MDVKTDIKTFINSEIIDGESNVQLTDDTQLIDTGIIDSLGIMKLLTFIEETFGLKVDEEDLVPDNFESIERITQLVDKMTLAN